MVFYGAPRVPIRTDRLAELDLERSDLFCKFRYSHCAEHLLFDMFKISESILYFICGLAQTFGILLKHSLTCIREVILNWMKGTTCSIKL